MIYFTVFYFFYLFLNFKSLHQISFQIFFFQIYLRIRLLPYLLDLLTDNAKSVSSSALNCLRKCGQQYEEEHADDIIEKRQYGIDGDDRINLEKVLPFPFIERPRIGKDTFYSF